MAKRRSRQTSRQPERDVSTSSHRYPRARAAPWNDFLPSGALDSRPDLWDRSAVRSHDPLPPSVEQMEDDLRYWHPADVGALRSPPRYRGSLTPARVVIGKTRTMPRKAPGSSLAAFSGPAFPTFQLRWAEPLRLGLCRRRSIRRQVLHALGFTGKGSGGRGRRNFFSSISC